MCAFYKNARVRSIVCHLWRTGDLVRAWSLSEHSVESRGRALSQQNRITLLRVWTLLPSFCWSAVFWIETSPGWPLRKVKEGAICQAEAAGKLGDIPQFSPCDSYFSSPARIMSDQDELFSTHYISHIKDTPLPYRNEKQASKTVPKAKVLIRQLHWWGRNEYQLLHFTFCLQTVDISVELALVAHSLFSKLQLCDKLFFDGIPRELEASLQTHSSVLTGHTQPRRMW